MIIDGVDEVIIVLCAHVERERDVLRTVVVVFVFFFLFFFLPAHASLCVWSG